MWAEKEYKKTIYLKKQATQENNTEKIGGFIQLPFNNIGCNVKNI